MFVSPTHENPAPEDLGSVPGAAHHFLGVSLPRGTLCRAVMTIAKCDVGRDPAPERLGLRLNGMTLRTG